MVSGQLSVVSCRFLGFGGDDGDAGEFGGEMDEAEAGHLNEAAFFPEDLLHACEGDVGVVIAFGDKAAGGAFVHFQIDQGSTGCQQSDEFPEAVFGRACIADDGTDADQVNLVERRLFRGTLIIGFGGAGIIIRMRLRSGWLAAGFVRV